MSFDAVLEAFFNLNQTERRFVNDNDVHWMMVLMKIIPKNGPISIRTAHELIYTSSRNKRITAKNVLVEC